MTYFVGSQEYELDEGWGRLPKGYEFNQVAGVTVDGNVYLFNRSSHELMVFDRQGNLLEGMGADLPPAPRPMCGRYR